MPDVYLTTRGTLRSADGIPIEVDRTVVTGVSFNETGTPWEGHGHKFLSSGKKRQKESHKRNKRIMGDRIRWTPTKSHQSSSAKKHPRTARTQIFDPQTKRLSVC